MAKWIACAAAILITLAAMYFSEGPPILPGQGIAPIERFYATV